jgi:ribosomal protein S8
MNYELADMISRLTVSSRAHLFSVYVRNTNLNFRILKVLYINGIIRGFKFDSKRQKDILVFLKYHRNLPIFKKICIVSRPGCRIYWRLGKLALTYNKGSFAGFYIISTPKGLLTSFEALLLKRRGGEILVQIVL